jgi:hypothetical protein
MTLSPPTTNPDRDYAFWDSHDGVGLVWSNPHASDSVMISNALLSPSFHQLLDIAVEFGLDRLESEWETLKSDYLSSPCPQELKQISLAQPVVERILRNIAKGFQEIA